MTNSKKIKEFKTENPKVWSAFENIYEFSERLDKHHVFLLSGGIAFNLMMYSLPLLLVAIYVVDLIFGVKNITPVIKDFAIDFLPPTDEVAFYLEKIINEANRISEHSAVFGIIGIFVLFWIASLLISSFRTALNSVFEFPPKHFFLVYRLKDILLIILFSITIFISTYVLPLVSFAYSLLMKYVPDFLSNIISGFGISLITLGTAFFVFFIIYRFIPHNKLPKYISLYASLLSAVAIELGRHIFGWYITTVANYGKFYGTFAVVVSLAIWIYYSSLIIMISAEFVNFIHDKRLLRQEKQKPTLKKMKKHNRKIKH